MKHFKSYCLQFDDARVVDIDDCSEVYWDIPDDRDTFDLLDEDNTCTVNAGGCLYLTQCGVTACVHCGRRVT